MRRKQKTIAEAGFVVPRQGKSYCCKDLNNKKCPTAFCHCSQN